MWLNTGHIPSVCITMVHFVETDAQICDCDPTKLDVSNDHLFLSETFRSSMTLHISPELNEIHNDLETRVSNQPVSYQIFSVLATHTVFHYDSHISDENSYFYDKYMLNESNHDKNRIQFW